MITLREAQIDAIHLDVPNCLALVSVGLTHMEVVALSYAERVVLGTGQYYRDGQRAVPTGMRACASRATRRVLLET